MNRRLIDTAIIWAIINALFILALIAPLIVVIVPISKMKMYAIFNIINEGKNNS